MRTNFFNENHFSKHGPTQKELAKRDEDQVN